MGKINNQLNDLAKKARMIGKDIGIITCFSLDYMSTSETSELLGRFQDEFYALAEELDSIKEQNNEDKDKNKIRRNVKMAKINREEYCFLKGLNDRWKWIARDEDLSVYDDKPIKVHSVIPCWDISTEKNEWQRINRSLFRFIQWSDSEPYNIQELIEGYEHSAEHLSHVPTKE